MNFVRYSVRTMRSLCFTHSARTSYFQILNPTRTAGILKPEFKCVQNAMFSGFVHIDKTTISSLTNAYDTFLIDLDGTMWGVDHVTPIPGISKAVENLRKLNKKLIFVTNNSIHGNLHYIEKFNQFGFDAPEDDIFGVAHASAIYLKDILNINGLVYVVGSYGMAAELDHVGIEHFGVGPDPDEASWDPEVLMKMKIKQNVEAVLVGYDEHFHYNKIFKAASYIKNKNCHFVATNDVEIGFQLDNDRFQPVTGTLVKAISTAVNMQPQVVGKPHRLMLECVRRKHDFDISRTIFIGDSIKADITFANNVGVDSALVLTGVNSEKDIANYPGVNPTYILDSFVSFSEC